MLKKKSHIILSSILGVLVLVFIVQSLSMNTKAQIVDPLNDQAFLSEAEEVEAFLAETVAETAQIGTSFQSGNISLSTSDTVSMMIPVAEQGVVHFAVDPVAETASASVNVTVNNLKPSFDYYLYRDQLVHNPEIASTDANGSLIVAVPTDATHFIYLQDTKSTYIIDALDGGDCENIVFTTNVSASWATEVCTLPTGATLTDTIAINGAGVTLEGNGATIDITGNIKTTGLQVSADNVTVNNLNVKTDSDNTYAVNLAASAHFNLDNVDVEFTTGTGNTGSIDRGIHSSYPYLTITDGQNDAGFSITNSDIVDTSLDGARFWGLTLRNPVGGTVDGYSFDTSASTSLAALGMQISALATPSAVQQGVTITNSNFDGNTVDSIYRGVGMSVNTAGADVDVNLTNINFDKIGTGIQFGSTGGDLNLNNVDCTDIRSCFWFVSNLGSAHVYDSTILRADYLGIGLGKAPWPDTFTKIYMDEVRNGIGSGVDGGTTVITDATIVNGLFGFVISPYDRTPLDLSDNFPVNITLNDSVILNNAPYNVRCDNTQSPGSDIFCAGEGNFFSEAPFGWTGSASGWDLAADADGDNIPDPVDLFEQDPRGAKVSGVDFVITPSGDPIVSSLTTGRSGNARINMRNNSMRVDLPSQSEVEATLGSLGIRVVDGSAVMTDDDMVKATLGLNDNVVMDYDPLTHEIRTEILSGSPLVEFFHANGDLLLEMNSGVMTVGRNDTGGLSYAGVYDYTGYDTSSNTPSPVTNGNGNANGNANKGSLILENVSGNLDLEILDAVTEAPVATVALAPTQIVEIAVDLVNSVTNFERVDSNGPLVVNIVAGDGSVTATMTTNGGEEFDLAGGGSNSIDVVNTGTVAFDFVNLIDNTTVTVNPGDATNVTSEPIGPTGPIGTIEASITSNLKSSNGGQEPLVGALVKAFDVNDACVASYLPDSNDVNTNCTEVSTCTTDDAGQCSLVVSAEESYFMLTEEPNHRGILPSHSLGIVKEGEFKNFVLSFLQ